MQHLEFFNKDHFDDCYHRRKPDPALSKFIDFFWETNFDCLWEKYPEGFSDALFPNIGYTYLINLGTPFVMQMGDESHEIKSDGFLPRYKNIEAHHTKGNKVFGIKFKVSPVVFEKKINFFEYREYIYPLAYLIDREIVNNVKEAESFDDRVKIVSDYYVEVLKKHPKSLKYVDIVTEILEKSYEANDFTVPIESLSKNYNISSRTLQRYFEAATSITSKQALQIMRIRKAVEHIKTDPSTFHFTSYGYYDYSHFYKHVRQFLGKHTRTLFNS